MGARAFEASLPLPLVPGSVMAMLLPPPGPAVSPQTKAMVPTGRGLKSSKSGAGKQKQSKGKTKKQNQTSSPSTVISSVISPRQNASLGEPLHFLLGDAASASHWAWARARPALPYLRASRSLTVSLWSFVKSLRSLHFVTLDLTPEASTPWLSS